jgi:DNA helicase HerA-like ATPase
MLSSQTDGDVFVGDLQVGEKTLDVPVMIKSQFLPMHVGIFGATGSGKSNLMMVLIKSLFDSNIESIRDSKADLPRISAFCIDPHDEFAKGVDKYGIQSIVESMDQDTRKEVLGDFYYLTTRLQATKREVRRYAREIRILWQEVQPRDLYSIMEFTLQALSVESSEDFDF